MSNEKTFGTRLENARALVGLFAGMPSYTAHVPELDPTAFAQLVVEADTAHSSFLDLQHQLAVWRDKRKKILHGDAQNAGLLANLRNVRAAVLATFGKGSLQVVKVSELTTKMRSRSPVKTKKSSLDPSEPTQTNSISRNTTSYGSIAQNFAALVQLLASFGARYQPASTHLQVATLQTISNELNAENTNTQIALAAAQIQKNRRDTAFATLSERFALIKAHILATYGAKSPEYKNALRLKI